MVGLELLMLAAMAAATGVVAWRLPRLGRDRRWSAGARALGLVVAGEGRAWGQLEGFEVEVRWTDDEHATLRFLRAGSAPPDRVADVRHRLSASVALGHRELPGTDWRWRNPEEAAEISAIGLAALGALDREGTLAFALRARAGHEARALGTVAPVAAWIARELGWAPTFDARTSRSSWEAMLGGFVPSGSVRFGSSERRRARARTAAGSTDPWIATLGALHLGPEGVGQLRRTALDPAQPDELVAMALRGVWDALSARELAGLLARNHEEVVVRAAWGLARVGTRAEVAALHRWRRDPGPRGRAVRTALHAIFARAGAEPGAIADTMDPLVKRLAELRARAADDELRR